jgi:hypothetical protein
MKKEGKEERGKEERKGKGRKKERNWNVKCLF